MTILYERQGGILKVFLLIEGEKVYVGFWANFLEFLDCGSPDTLRVNP